MPKKEIWVDSISEESLTAPERILNQREKSAAKDREFDGRYRDEAFWDSLALQIETEAQPQERKVDSRLEYKTFWDTLVQQEILEDTLKKRRKFN